MTQEYIVNDIVKINVLNNSIVSRYDKYDTIVYLKLIKISDNNYIFYVPDNLNIKNTTIATNFYINKYSLSKKYLDCNIALLTHSYLISLKSREDGMYCTKCGEFCQMVQANYAGNFICYSCRNRLC